MKKNIALVAGGYSGEYQISIQTAKTIMAHLDSDRYAVYLIVIEKNSWWHEHQGRRWEVDKNDFSIPREDGAIRFDAVFIAVHGTPGEDGRLQGYFDMIGLPYTSCNAIVSALTFNKSYCNKVVKDFHIAQIANSFHLIRGVPYSVGNILEKIRLPVFVKPNESGSSLGVTKVKSVEQLLPAIERAFQEDNQVLVEEFIEGRELTIGVYKEKGQIYALPATEIVSSNEFFDFEAKYTPGVTEEITPAPIDEMTREMLETKAIFIYRHLDCRGVVRMDFILQRKTGKLFFLEVNTMPGQSETSLVPQQVQAAGKSLREFYGAILEECLRQHEEETGHYAPQRPMGDPV